MAKLSYVEFHDYVKVLAQKLRQQSFIPRFILADKNGLIAASFLARKFQWYPILIDSRNFNSKGVEGKILVFSICSNNSLLALQSAANLILQDGVVNIVTAALIEVSVKVDFSATDSPEEIDAPWA